MASLSMRFRIWRCRSFCLAAAPGPFKRSYWSDAPPSCHSKPPAGALIEGRRNRSSARRCRMSGQPGGGFPCAPAPTVHSWRISVASQIGTSFQSAPLVWRRRVIEHMRVFASLDTSEFLDSATLVGKAPGIDFFGIANCPQPPLAFLPCRQHVGVAHPVMGQISQFMGV